MKKSKRPNNLIWILAVLAVLTAVSALGAGSAFSDALALDQAPRCGIEEHVHTAGCYVGDILICEKKMHTHTENCYLVRLEDNDINALLSLVGETEDRSLESLIRTTVVSAMALRGEAGASGGEGASPSPSVGPTAMPSLSPLPTLTPFPSLSPIPSLSPSPVPSLTPSPIPSLSPSASPALPSLAPVQEEPQPITNDSIVQLNVAAEALDVRPRVTLNESLVTLAAFEATQSEEELLAALLLTGETGGSGGISPAAETEPDTSAGALNLYIYVDDGSYVCIGNTRLSTTTYNFYSATASALAAFFTDNIVSSITSNTITDYSICYNTDGSDAYDTSATTYGSSFLFGRTTTTSARYATLTTSSGGWRPTYTPVQFYTVNLQYPDRTESYYVQSGRSITLDSAYNWTWNGTAVSGSQTITSGPRTYVATIPAYTVTYIAGGGTVRTDTVLPANAGSYTITQSLPDGYAAWRNETTKTVHYPGEAFPLTGDTAFIAVRQVTATFVNTDNSPAAGPVTALQGEVIALPDPGSGYVWAQNGGYYPGGDAYTLDADVTFVRTPEYTVTFVHAGGRQTSEFVVSGGTVTIPALADAVRNFWVDENGTKYAVGDTVTVNGNMTFYERATLTVTYSVSFPELPNRLLDAEPTLVGSASVKVAQGSDYTVSTVSDRDVIYYTAYDSAATGGKNNSRYGAAYFAGWKTETETVIQPGVRLTWEELSAYDKDGDGTVALTGNWMHGGANGVNFFVKYNSYNDGQTIADAYTPVVFATYVDYTDTNFSIELASGSTDYLTNDKLIRAMYGSGDVPWLASFPSDAYIFEQLKQYASDLTVPVEGKTGVFEQVNVNDLNEYGYAIRWYAFKYISEDGDWHVDGALVRKVGKVHTTKTFAGNATLIQRAKDGFYITAVNTPAEGESEKRVVMTLTAPTDAEQARILAEMGWAAGGVAWLTPVDDGDGNENTYLWEFDDVKYNEEWTITEHPPDVAGTAQYGEWIVVDSSALGQSGSGPGQEVTVKGVTQAADLTDPEWLRAEFENTYYLSNTLMLKKEDGSTGQVLSGVRFQFLQNGQPITFRYDAENDLYVRAADGDLDTLTVGEGYANISLEGFSYDAGDIVIREVSPPAGYETVGDVSVGYTTDENGNRVIGITNGANYAQYHEGLVVIQNDPSLRDVTVNKTWNCDESEKGDVELQLLANGDAALTARILAGRKDADGNSVPVTVTLTQAGGWTYTWHDMPLYANGQRVTYTVREIKIAGEYHDGSYSFANWLVTYKPAVTDADGNVTLGVENTTPNRPMLYVFKTDLNGAPLAGAKFELVAVDAGGDPVTNAIVKTAVSGEDGSLSFDNLSYETRYRLTELSAPDGYWACGPAFLTIQKDGSVTVEPHLYVKAAAEFTVTVENRSAASLPATGGGGTSGYCAAGAALMLLALCAAILPRLRKGRYRMRN